MGSLSKKTRQGRQRSTIRSNLRLIERHPLDPIVLSDLLLVLAKDPVARCGRPCRATRHERTSETSTEPLPSAGDAYPPQPTTHAQATAIETGQSLCETQGGSPVAIGTFVS